MKQTFKHRPWNKNTSANLGRLMFPHGFEEGSHLYLYVLILLINRPISMSCVNKHQTTCDIWISPLTTTIGYVTRSLVGLLLSVSKRRIKSSSFKITFFQLLWRILSVLFEFANIFKGQQFILLKYLFLNKRKTNKVIKRKKQGNRKKVQLYEM